MSKEAETTNSLADTSMQTHGKSFYFASQVFNKEQAQKIQALYSFCRYVDDCADELDSKDESLSKLSEIKNELDDLKTQTIPIHFQEIIEYLNSQGVTKKDLSVLVDGALFDVKEQSILSKNDLINYCYMVAGVVGEMMIPLLKIEDKNNAKPFAIDLGIAMQLTNIIRDINEDFRNDRIYLWKLRAHDGELRATQENMEVVEEALNCSEAYYKSAFEGLSYIPLRPRIAILIALNLYRAIGRKIKKEGFEIAFKQRVYLNKSQKIWVSFKSLVYLFNFRFWKAKEHDTSLHSKIHSKFKKSYL